MANIIWTPFNQLLTNLINTRYRQQSAPASFSLLLCNNSTWDSTDDFATVSATEVAVGNGYTGSVVCTPAAAASYDATQARSEITFGQVQIAASSGGVIEYDRAVVIGAGGTLELYANFGTQQIVEGSPHTFIPYLNIGGGSADVEAV